MVTFKGEWSKLYYTQHTFLNNVRQLPFFFFFLWETNTHTKKGEGKGPQLHSKDIVTFKEGWGKLYYTQNTLLSNVRQLLIIIIFFFRNEHTHKEEGKGF